MATKTPRVAVTLKPETLAVLADLAKLQKRPRSSIAADLLDEAVPVLRRLAAVLKAAHAAQAQTTPAALARLEAIADTVLASHQAAMDLLDPASGQQAQKGRGRRRKH